MKESSNLSRIATRFCFVRPRKNLRRGFSQQDYFLLHLWLQIGPYPFRIETAKPGRNGTDVDPMNPIGIGILQKPNNSSEKPQGRRQKRRGGRIDTKDERFLEVLCRVIAILIFPRDSAKSVFQHQYVVLEARRSTCFPPVEPGNIGVDH